MNRFLILFIIFIVLIRPILNLNANNETYINTSNIIYDEENNIIELAENSKININNANILVDRGIIDYNKDIIEVYGNFYLYQELNILSGKDLVGNTNMSNFTAEAVSYIYNDDLKIDSDRAKRSKENIFFYNNFITPCELDGYFNCPTWSLRIDETIYNIENDKFTHFDTFLQIADYKLFYLPYFTHYGVKAPRKKGFLTPSMELTIGGDTGLITPYYLPISQNSEIIFKPKIILDGNTDFYNNYTLNTFINHMNSRGNIYVDFYNEKLGNNANSYSSAKIEGKQTINKYNTLSFEALVTNNISTTRSINEVPSTFEDIFIRLDSYDVFIKSDFLSSQIYTVEALDSTKTGFVPLSPSIKYINQNLLKSNMSFSNEIDISNFKRESSSVNNPSESNVLKVKNSIFLSDKINKTYLYNKFYLISHISDYSFEHDSSLNNDALKSSATISSEAFYTISKNYLSRFKLVHNTNLISDTVINEDSKALTFNYHNQFSDSRLYGYDLDDNSTRAIYGIESSIVSFGNIIDLNINQSYDFKSKTNYTNLINQSSNFSDIALELKTELNSVLIKVDTRLSNRELEKKEMNYSLSYDKDIFINLEYNETDSEAFKDISSDSKSLGINLSKKINNNLKFSTNSNLDLKNNYSPYTQSFKISLFDECSKLDLTYKDQRFNDNYNTTPSETISLSFYMDYLGYFGYEQSTNLFFEEVGNFNYAK